MKTLFRNIYIYSILGIIACTGYAYTTQAQTTIPENMPDNSNVEYTLLEPLPDLNNPGNETVSSLTFKEYVQYTFNLFIALSAAAAVFMIVFGGFQYMTTDSWSGKSAGIAKVKNALLGLLLVLGSYLLLRTIDPRLVNIPSTLVKPLKIQYEKTSNSLLDSLSDIASYKYMNQKLITENKELYNKIQGLKKDKEGILNEIRSVLGEDSLTETEIKDICENSAKSNVGGSSLSILCGEYYKNDSNIIDASRNFEYNVGIGKLNAKIQDCYSYRETGIIGNNRVDESKFKLCLEDIQIVSKTHAEKLKNLGDAQKSLEVQDYSKLALAVAYMNKSLINNVGENPYTKAAIDTAQSAITVVGTGAGVILGGGAGGSAGFVTAQAFKGIMNGALVTNNKTAVQQTIVDVRGQYTTYSQQISSKPIREQLKAQANAYLKGLGVKDAELIQ